MAIQDVRKRLKELASAPYDEALQEARVLLKPLSNAEAKDLGSAEEWLAFFAAHGERFSAELNAKVTTE